jgi:hypothetical protein
MILIVVALGFAGALLVTWPRRESPAPVPLAAAPAWAAPKPWQAAAWAGGELPAGQSAGSRGAQRGSQPGESAPEVADTAPPLPVHLVLQSRRIHESSWDPRDRDALMSIRISNSSSEALPLEVFVWNSERGSEGPMELGLGPYETKELGSDGAVEIHSGDVITVKSPNFRDLTYGRRAGRTPTR